MKIYEKHKEKILYLFFGALTTIISLITYYLFTFTILNVDNPLELQIANIISWIAGFTFAYFTNREYVFNSNNKDFKEFIKFFLSRIFTLLLDMLIMYIFVTKLKYNDRLFKIISQIIVIVTNYILSKLIVFKK
jgi:putative flippase GtrA